MVPGHDEVKSSATVPAMTVWSIVAPWHRVPVAQARSALFVRDGRAHTASAAAIAAATFGVNGAIAPAAAAAGQPWPRGATS